MGRQTRQGKADMQLASGKRTTLQRATSAGSRQTAKGDNSLQRETETESCGSSSGQRGMSESATAEGEAIEGVAAHCITFQFPFFLPFNFNSFALSFMTLRVPLPLPPSLSLQFSLYLLPLSFVYAGSLRAAMEMKSAIISIIFHA